MPTLRFKVHIKTRQLPELQIVIMPPKPKYADGEKVLCYHGPLLYEAKVREMMTVGYDIVACCFLVLCMSTILCAILSIPLT